MLRINARSCECVERLELQGRLTKPYLPELEKAVVEARARSARVALDVAELSFVDVDGARALRRQQVEVHGCSAFVAELLGLDRSEAPSRGDPCSK